MKSILKLKLKILAKLFLIRYKPTIIAISGSLGKTSTKNAVYELLSNFYPSRKSYKSYNNQIGVPLTIMGFKTAGKSLFGWFKIIIIACSRLIYQPNYPKILVLEMGADRIGDLAYLTSIAKPDVSVLTSIGFSHLEYFKSIDNIYKEKTKLIRSLKSGGTAILNFDDKRLREAGLETNKEVIFYGLNQEANFSADNIKQTRKGLGFKVRNLGNWVPVKVPALGKHQVYNLLAAFSVGSIFDLNLVDMAKAVSNYQSEKGRLRLLKGKKDSLIIDDSYNSAPESARNALDLLVEISESNQRKVAIIGDMLELGEKTKSAHQELAHQAAEKADLVVFVGDQAELMASSVCEIRKTEKVISFYDSSQLNKKLLSIINKGDIVLFKASQGVRLDESIKILLDESLNPSKVLVRQSEEWKNK